MEQKKPRQNRLAARGWIWAGSYKLERYLYTLHRVTGLGLLLFVIIHLFVTTVFRVQGQDTWEAAIGFLGNPLFKVGEALVAVAFSYHALNGLRLITQELGFLIGKPTPPVYPWKDSLRKKRVLSGVIMAVIVFVAALFLFDFLAGGK